MLSAPSILMAKKYCECRNDFFFMQREEEWPADFDGDVTARGFNCFNYQVGNFY